MQEFKVSLIYIAKSRPGIALVLHRKKPVSKTQITDKSWSHRHLIWCLGAHFSLDRCLVQSRYGDKGLGLPLSDVSGFVDSLSGVDGDGEREGSGRGWSERRVGWEGGGSGSRDGCVE